MRKRMHQVAKSASKVRKSAAKVGKSGTRWAHLLHPGSFLRPAGPFLASLEALLRTSEHLICIFVQYT